jgi:ferredoxin
MEEKERYAIVLETPEGERSFGCDRDQFIWDAAALHGIRLPAICHQGRCLTCAGRLVNGSVDQSKAVSYFPEDSRAGFILLCTAQPRSDIRVVTDQQLAMREHRLGLGLPAPYA